jgi:hypothetical protein
LIVYDFGEIAFASGKDVREVDGSKKEENESKSVGSTLFHVVSSPACAVY